MSVAIPFQNTSYFGTESEAYLKPTRLASMQRQLVLRIGLKAAKLKKRNEPEDVCPESTATTIS